MYCEKPFSLPSALPFLWLSKPAFLWRSALSAQFRECRNHGTYSRVTHGSRKADWSPSLGIIKQEIRKVDCFSLVAMLKRNAPERCPEPCFPRGGEIQSKWLKPHRQKAEISNREIRSPTEQPWESLSSRPVGTWAALVCPSWSVVGQLFCLSLQFPEPPQGPSVNPSVCSNSGCFVICYQKQKF